MTDTPNQPTSTEPDIRALLETVIAQNKKIERRLRWMVIGGWLRIALIVIPLGIGLIFLPPLFADAFKQYGDLLK